MVSCYVHDIQLTVWLVHSWPSISVGSASVDPTTSKIKLHLF